MKPLGDREYPVLTPGRSDVGSQQAGTCLLSIASECFFDYFLNVLFRFNNQFFSLNLDFTSVFFRRFVLIYRIIPYIKFGY